MSIDEVSYMKKSKFTLQQLIGVVVYFVTGGACGLLIVSYLDHNRLSVPMEIMMFAVLLISLYLAMLIQIIIHESGHLVFGLLTGYGFLSFRILSWMWMRDKNGITFRRFSLAGTGGQCLMSPPDYHNGDYPFLLYNFGGSLMNLIFSALFLVVSFLVPSYSLAAVLLRVLVIVGLAFAIMNGVPLHMGVVDNDGCNAVSLMKSAEAKRAFWISLKVNEELGEGKGYRDMPEEWFEMPDEKEMKNGIVAPLGVMREGRFMSEHRFPEAEELIDELLSMKNGIVGLHRTMLENDRIYINLIDEEKNGIPEIPEDLKKILKSMKNYPSVLRTDYASALLKDHDKNKAEEIRKRFERMALSYPYEVEIREERELMDHADTVYEGKREE